MALKGVKVLELAGLAPAPFCGMILAEFGATVIRVDKIGANTAMDCLANGKQSIAVNLKHPQGINIIKKLSSQSDVLLEPFRKGIMESLGLGPNVLCKENPRLIYARLTGYGQSGEYSKKAGHDINYVALSGLLSLFGRHKENPVFPINLAADFAGGGLMCALGIVLALFERNSSGLGQIVDNSMVAGTSYLGSWFYRSQKLPIWGNERGKNILDTGAHFYEVYKTKDGKYISVGALEPQFYENLLQGLNLTQEEVPHFTEFEKNKQIFERKFKEKTLDEWMKVFENLDACVAPVLDIYEAPKHKHNVEQSTFTLNGEEESYAPNPAPVLSRTPGSSRSTEAAPRGGEQTRQILRSMKYTEEEINLLEEGGVVECYGKSKL